MHRAGFANQPTSIHKDDGLKLTDAYVTAACRCAPPDNKPLPEELANCRPFLLREMELLQNLRVILGLGKIGFDTAFFAHNLTGAARMPESLLDRVHYGDIRNFPPELLDGAMSGSIQSTSRSA